MHASFLAARAPRRVALHTATCCDDPTTRSGVKDTQTAAAQSARVSARTAQNRRAYMSAVARTRHVIDRHGYLHSCNTC
jgi:hypothetical protein